MAQTTSINETRRSKAILAIKLLLFSASVIPSLLAGAIAFGNGHFVMWWFVLLVFAMFVGQAAGDYLYYYFTNFHNDARDSHTKIFAGWKPLFTGSLISDKGTLWAGLFCLLIDLFIGIYFFLQFGFIILLMAVAGAMIAIFFTPLMLRGYKEPLIFVTFGPLILTSVFFVLAQKFSWEPLLASLPVAFFVTVVAYLKGARFIVKQDSDGQKVLNIKTQVIQILYMLGYMSLLGLAAFKLIPVWSLLGLASLPMAWGVLKATRGSSSEVSVYLWAVVRSIYVLIVTGLLMAASYLF
jgi:1,4-dihydroxy-2-naphthoate octaprenyltransferase